jgi:hypothetical protein
MGSISKNIKNEIVIEERKSLEDVISIWETVKNTDKRSGFVFTVENKHFISCTKFDKTTETYTIDEDNFQKWGERTVEKLSKI